MKEEIQMTGNSFSQSFPQFIESFQMFFIFCVFFCKFLASGRIRINVLKSHLMIDLRVAVFQPADFLFGLFQVIPAFALFCLLLFLLLPAQLKPGLSSGARSVFISIARGGICPCKLVFLLQVIVIVPDIIYKGLIDQFKYPGVRAQTIYSHSLCCTPLVRLAGSVASLCMARSKLCTLTCTTKSRPHPGPWYSQAGRLR